jgi:hypothetical protein
VVRSVALVVALLLTVAGRVDAHPLHSSFTEITRERGGTLVLAIRLFADDFGATLDSLRAKSPGASRETVAKEYLARAVAITGLDGQAVSLEWCGMRSEDELVFLCARSAEPVRKGALRLRNALMFDRFADQISIVRWQRGSGTRTLVLSARAPVAQLD